MTNEERNQYGGEGKKSVNDARLEMALQYISELRCDLDRLTKRVDETIALHADTRRRLQ